MKPLPWKQFKRLLKALWMTAQLSGIFTGMDYEPHKAELMRLSQTLVTSLKQKTRRSGFILTL
ncbi:hypothetical protein SOD10_39390 [Serratia plymuthica]|uniref:hypothetical protein n=1 Tax=Serratia plymuthica TaxID=82996 RepID=UPI00041D4F04|nr:hypothetical protein [Serratia plymuthica]KYG14964.1 hypothetical protein SOD10_39390 [Serratia plymuthica]QPS89672.1 hypothetical protein I6G46_12335 [Serratia plymuthica]QQT82714.1 hypothetical protein I6I95_02190 [Serratia plymuthica]